MITDSSSPSLSTTTLPYQPTPSTPSICRPYKRLPVLLTILLLCAAGCSTPALVESPICVPLRPVLVPISAEDQLAIREEVGRDVLEAISTNDLKLKSSVRLLEGLIAAHDAPLGDCE